MNLGASFQSWVARPNRLKKSCPIRGDYQTVTKTTWNEFLQQLTLQSEFALDLETTSLDTTTCDIVGASFSWSDTGAYYVPLRHTHSTDIEQVPWTDFLGGVAPVLDRPSTRIIGHNLKFDISVLRRSGFAVTTMLFDTKIAHYLIDADSRSFNLTVAASEFLGQRVIEYTDVTRGLSNFSEVEIEPATRYACQDAHFAWLLKEKLAPRLADGKLVSLFSDLEMPLVSVLSNMEMRGIRVDKSMLESMSAEFALELAHLEEQIFHTVGSEFNVNSPKQLSEILFTQDGASHKGH